MTYRERREAKAAKLREWAEKRDAKAAALLRQNEPYVHDWAFITQPGHIPERARVNAREDRAIEHMNTADEMERRAAGIEAQADHAIYRDDPDAADRLREKIAELEAERERKKAINAQLRAAAKKGDEATKAVLATLDEHERHTLLLVAEYQSYYDPLHKGFPSYEMTNLGGNIRRYQERLRALEDTRPKLPRMLSVKYPGVCRECGATIERGAYAAYYADSREIACASHVS